MQLDLALPCAVCPANDFAVLSAGQSQAEWSEQFCTGHAGPWSTGRELRLVIDSLLI
jgi:hypothetical protein